MARITLFPPPSASCRHIDIEYRGRRHCFHFAEMAERSESEHPLLAHIRAAAKAAGINTYAELRAWLNDRDID
jgi:hypothetical protein